MYRQDLGNGLIPINTFLMSLCCSPLLELTADGRTWLHLPCIEMSDAGGWSKLEQPAVSRVKQ